MKSIILLTALILLCIPSMTSQDFDSPLINPFNLTTEGARSSPFSVDIDDDGDPDVFTGYVGGQFGFYLNSGSSTIPDFDPVSINPFGLTGVSGDCAPALADLDDDGDLDMMAGSDNGLIYFENEGNASTPSFGIAVVNPFGIIGPTGNNQPELADIDNDGDYDLFVGSSDGNTYYYPNTGNAGNPSFGAPQMNPFGVANSGSRSSPNLVDLDSDGDLDLMIGNQSGQFNYYENTGNSNAPSFSFISENPFNLSNVGQDSKPDFVDLDSDGDSDLLSGNAIGEYYYFENIAPLGIDGRQALTVVIYPNPFHSFTHIRLSEIPEGPITLYITDSQGRNVALSSVLRPDGTVLVYRNGVQAGIYFAYAVQSEKRVFLGKLIIK